MSSSSIDQRSKSETSPNSNDERQLVAFFDALRRPGSDVVEVRGTL